jgi:hypothetical protein
VGPAGDAICLSSDRAIVSQERVVDAEVNQRCNKKKKEKKVVLLCEKAEVRVLKKEVAD